jgi:hypothetical protein
MRQGQGGRRRHDGKEGTDGFSGYGMHFANSCGVERGCIMTKAVFARR